MPDGSASSSSREGRANPDPGALRTASTATRRTPAARSRRPVKSGPMSDLREMYEVGRAVGKGGYAVVYKGTRRDDGTRVAIKQVDLHEMSERKRLRVPARGAAPRQPAAPGHRGDVRFVPRRREALHRLRVGRGRRPQAPPPQASRAAGRPARRGNRLENLPSKSTPPSPHARAPRHAPRHQTRERPRHRERPVQGGGARPRQAVRLQHRSRRLESRHALRYVSPEVVKGEPYDWSSDVWSLGCLLYELATLRSPFEMEGANLYAVFQRISTGSWAPLPSHRFSPPLVELVRQMMDPNPRDRPSAREVSRRCGGRGRVRRHRAGQSSERKRRR